MSVRLMQSGDQFTVKDSELVSGGDGETSYTVRAITREVKKSLEAKHTSQIPNRRTHQMDSVLNNEAYFDDLLDYVLVDWSGILLGSEPVPCERDHKLKLDVARCMALLERAGMSQIQEGGASKSASFRVAPDVR